MIRIKKYTWLVLLAGVTTVSSCKKDFLELTSPTSLLPAQALGTEADLQVAVRGAYSALRSVNLYGRTLPIVGDMLGDNAYQSVLNTNRYTLYITITHLIQPMVMQVVCGTLLTIPFCVQTTSSMLVLLLMQT
jgi:hypothetical protein